MTPDTTPVVDFTGSSHWRPRTVIRSLQTQRRSSETVGFHKEVLVQALNDKERRAESRRVEQTDANHSGGRIWFFQFGPCWCRGTPGGKGSFDFLRLREAPSSLNGLETNILLLSDRILEGSRATLKSVYDRVPDPKLVISGGPCRAAEPFWQGVTTTPLSVDSVVPVDLRIEQCISGFPEALLSAVLNLMTSRQTLQSAAGQAERLPA